MRRLPNYQGSYATISAGLPAQDDVPILKGLKQLAGFQEVGRILWSDAEAKFFARISLVEEKTSRPQPLARASIQSGVTVVEANDDIKTRGRKRKLPQICWKPHHAHIACS